MVILQMIAGIVLGIAGIFAVFWFTFRRPPPRRHATSDVNTNSDAEYLVRYGNDDVYGGHF